MKAAVLVEHNLPLVTADLEAPGLASGQALVDIAFSGVCSTQVLEWRGFRGPDPYLPHCLGHEGSGRVVEVGRGVSKIQPGDRVILSWIKGSGADVPTTSYLWGDRRVNAGGITTFSHQTVVSENRLTIIPNAVPDREAALLGCTVPTGLGAVLNTAQPRRGQSIAIFGAGGIGLCAIAAAAIAGCTPIIAVDVQKHRLVLAGQMGSTHSIDGAGADTVAQVKQICPGGVDFAIEATGRPEVMVQALDCVRNQGGVAVIVGNARHGDLLALDPRQLNLGKQLRGTWGGDNWPDRDFPLYCNLLSTGRLNLEPLLTKTYRLEDINEAISDLENGRVIRPLIDMALN